MLEILETNSFQFFLFFVFTLFSIFCFWSLSFTLPVIILFKSSSNIFARFICSENFNKNYLLFLLFINPDISPPKLPTNSYYKLTNVLRDSTESSLSHIILNGDRIVFVSNNGFKIYFSNNSIVCRFA